MKFNSVKEYFYRLNSIGYQCMMLPLILFILFFGQSAFAVLPLLLTNNTWFDSVFWAVVGLTVISLTTVQFIHFRQANAIGRKVGLGLKLEEYADLAIKKMKWISVMTSLVALSLFLTGDIRLAITFVVILLYFFTQWPSPKTVARQLHLRGDEQKMVVTRGEAFKGL